MDLQNLRRNTLHKSSLVYIEGRLKTRHWEDRDHNKKVATEIIADNLIMLDKRADMQPEMKGSHENIPRNEIPPIDEGSEKLPF